MNASTVLAQSQKWGRNNGRSREWRKSRKSWKGRKSRKSGTSGTRKQKERKHQQTKRRSFEEAY